MFAFQYDVHDLTWTIIYLWTSRTLFPLITALYTLREYLHNAVNQDFR